LKFNPNPKFDSPKNELYENVDVTGLPSNPINSALWYNVADEYGSVEEYAGLIEPALNKWNLDNASSCALAW
jgi:hypothetical protein